MLRIAHPIDKKQTEQSETSVTESEFMRTNEELLQIKGRLELESHQEKNITKKAIANMFLEGPAAWPDYSYSEELDWSEEEEDEDWVPMDFFQDSQLRDASSEGQK